MTPEDEARARRLVLEIGEALHRYGTPAWRLEATLARVSTAVGLHGQFFCLPTSIIAAFGPLGAQKSGFLRVEPGGVDLGKLVRVDACVQGLLRGTMTADQAHDEVQRIVAGREEWSRAALLLCFALSSAFGARIFGGGWLDIGVSGVVGAILGGLALRMGRSTAPHLFEPVAATVAAALAVVAAAVVGPVRIEVVTLAGVLYVLPGLTLTLAMTELATRNYVSGAARLTMAVLSLLQLAFGVALGGRLALLLPVAHSPAAAAVFPLWADVAALVAVGLACAVLFQARLRDAPWILLAVLVAYAGARLGTFALGGQVGAFAGALAVGLASNLAARLANVPSLVPLVPGVLLLVPGSIGFRSVSGLLRGEVLGAVGSAFEMVMVAVALAVGLLVANVVLSPRRAL